MRKLIFVPLFLLLMAPKCGGDDIQNVAEALNIATKTVGGLQDTVIAAHDTLGEEVFPKKDADAIVSICKKVQEAIVSANDLTREFSQLPPEGRDEVLEILMPVMDALEVAVTAEALVLIADDDLRVAVELGFRTALGAMQTVQKIMEVSNVEQD